MGRKLGIGLVLILGLAMLAVLFAQEMGTNVPAIQLVGSDDSNVVSAADDPVGTQIAAQATSTVAAAQQAGADMMVTAMAQSTQEAQAAAAAAAEATRQAQIAATARVEAAAEATKRAEIAATSVAIEQIVVQATIEAGRAQGTATAQAQATGAAIVVAEATSAARAQATRTAVAATTTAVWVEPTLDVINADTSAYVTEKTWAERTTPWTTVGKALFWSALGLLTVLACAWVFPRAWIALQMRFLRVNNEADGPEWMIVGTKGLIQAWTGMFKATPYSSDRDRGPGQTIDPDRSEGLLPGSDPAVTRRDQATQGLARPVLAATRPAIPSRVGRSLTQTPGILGRGGRDLTRQRRPYRVLQPDTPLPPTVQGELDDIVLQQLDKDWEAA